MKHTLALILMVIGIVGCATNKMIVFSQPIDEPIEVSSKPVGKIQNFLIVDSYNNLSSSYQNGTTRQIGSSLKAEAMNISSAVAWGRLPFQSVFIIIAYWHSNLKIKFNPNNVCLLYTSPSPRDRSLSRMPSSA